MEEKVPQHSKPLLFFSVIDCDFCNCQGKIITFNKLTNEEVKVDCPICSGRGALRRYK